MERGRRAQLGTSRGLSSIRDSDEPAVRVTLPGRRYFRTYLSTAVTAFFQGAAVPSLLPQG
jgi:hypothetical protein